MECEKHDALSLEAKTRLRNNLPTKMTLRACNDFPARLDNSLYKSMGLLSHFLRRDQSSDFNYRKRHHIPVQIMLETEGNAARIWKRNMTWCSQESQMIGQSWRSVRQEIQRQAQEHQCRWEPYSHHNRTGRCNYRRYPYYKFLDEAQT